MDDKTGSINTASYEHCRQQLTEVTDALVEAYRTFNHVSDPAVMDSCISEINALRSRRNMILRDMRQLE